MVPQNLQANAKANDQFLVVGRSEVDPESRLLVFRAVWWPNVSKLRFIEERKKEMMIGRSWAFQGWSWTVLVWLAWGASVHAKPPNIL